ncbi:MAG: putative Ig domain-containing protein [Clostridiales bacterium]|nr:putative Ig domain-containing protein [Clostridiales bacterium]
MIRPAAVILLAAALCVLMSALPAKKALAAMGGDGSVGNPYTISTAQDLRDLAIAINDTHSSGHTVPGKYYKLVNDIDLSEFGSSFNSGKGWTPIGTSTWYFGGNFDGNGHKITGLYINDTTLPNAGLFGESHGTIHNLGLENVNIHGGSDVGAIAGTQNGGSMSYCYVTGTVSGSGSSVGGMAGYITGNCAISKSYVTASVSGASTVGGIGGYIFPGSIDNCYTTGNVTGSGNNVGGIGGNIANSTSTSYLRNSYATGVISGTQNVGGIIGGTQSNTLTVTYSVALNAKVSGNDLIDVARIVGYKNCTLTNNFAYTLMQDKNGQMPWTNRLHDQPNGKDVSAEDALKTVFWDYSVFWDHDIWLIQDGKLPILKGVGGDQGGDLPTDQKIDISGADATVNPDIYTYTGKIIYPAGITVRLNGKLLDPDNYTWAIVSADGAGTSAGVNAGTVTIAITGVGNYKGTAFATYEIAESEAPIIWVTLRSGKVGIDYGYQMEADKPAEFAIYDGSLPDGLTMSANGLVSGVPETAGEFTFTVIAKNADGFDLLIVTVQIGYFTTDFVVRITHSIDEMSATIMIMAADETLQGRNFHQEGYVFGGLYTDAAMTQAYNASAVITEDLELYAKWEKVSAKKTPDIVVMILWLSAIVAIAVLFICKKTNKSRTAK